MKLVLFGGSFDPPHLAHLALAQVALATIEPERLIWLPAGRPWQKPEQVMAPGPHRVAMVQRLIAGEPRFAVDARELHRTGATFTVHTLREFKAEFPGVELYFVLGQDQYARLHTWFQAEAVLALATIAVVPRDGQPVQAPPGLPRHEIVELNLPDTPISSTQVRAAAARGRDLAPYVGTEVASYIASHRLYENS